MPRRVAALLILPALLLLLAPCSLADDVPSSVREPYDEARRHLDAGDHKKAFAAISKGKARSPASVDFWELYVAIYRAVGKKEKVLWGKIIPKAEAKHPASPVFHVLRYRLAADLQEGIAHLERALETAPDDLEPKALLAREHIRGGDGESAVELIETVLASDSAHEMALALQGDLMLLEGRGQSALQHAEALLTQHAYPALHDLLARSLLALGGTDASRLGRAETEARRAHDARQGEWRFALTLVEALDRQGKTKEAKSLLAKTHAETPAPELAAKLGELAFRRGAYREAARGIARHPWPSDRALQALAVCHARLGQVEPTRDAIRRLLERGIDDDTRLWAAARELELGDARAALEHLGGLDSLEADRVRLRAVAWTGNCAEAIRIAGTRARGETRAAEAWLLPVVHALLFERLGDGAGRARTQLLDAAHAAARAEVKTATVPTEEPLLKSHTLGYLQRYATYRRALDGSFFVPRDELGMRQKDVDDIPTPIATVEADSPCVRDAKRHFPFRPADEVKDFDLQKTMTTWLGAPAVKRWNEALGGFGQGGAALLDGDPAKAREAFAWAVEKEPCWGRARLLGAVAAALEGKDMGGAAKDAELAAKALIDDWDGRTAGILVRLLAGRSVSAELKALAERRDSFAPRRYEELGFTAARR